MAKPTPSRPSPECAKVVRFFIDCDNDGHWYLIDASKRALWNKWLGLDSENEESWNTPFFARRIDRPQDVEFSEPIEQ